MAFGLEDARADQPVEIHGVSLLRGGIPQPTCSREKLGSLEATGKTGMWQAGGAGFFFLNPGCLVV